MRSCSPFQFSVDHKSGTQHANTDALSRHPCVLSGCSYCDRKDIRERELLGQGASTAPTCCVLQVVDAAEWAAHQEGDDYPRVVQQSIYSGQRPSWEAVSGLSLATKGLWSKFKVLCLSDGVLLQAWKEPGYGFEIPGHFGTSKNLCRLRREFYWGQHQRDVEDFCRCCDDCAVHKGPLDQSHAPLQQKASGAPMVDILGLFSVSVRGNKYVLCAMDYFTEWPEVYALDLCKRLKQLQTALCERLGIQKTRTMPLHPQSDGLVEWFNLTMQQQHCHCRPPA